MYHLSEASIFWIPAQDQDHPVSFLYLKNLNILLIECTHIKPFEAPNDVYSYLYEEKLGCILIFHSY